jgi:hypothetical protein
MEYGLLGASLSDEVAAWRISAPEDGEPWDRSLAGALDDVRWGLPIEFVDAVAGSTQAGLAAAQLSAGIDFDCAAHGLIGSSAALFGRIAAALVRLHANPDISGDERRLRGLLESLL